MVWHRRPVESLRSDPGCDGSAAWCTGSHGPSWRLRSRENLSPTSRRRQTATIGPQKATRETFLRFEHAALCEIDDATLTQHVGYQALVPEAFKGRHETHAGSLGPVPLVVAGATVDRDRRRCQPGWNLTSVVRSHDRNGGHAWRDRFGRDWGRGRGGWLGLLGRENKGERRASVTPAYGAEGAARASNDNGTPE